MDGDLNGWGEQYICTAAVYYPILIQPLWVLMECRRNSLMRMVFHFIFHLNRQCMIVHTEEGMRKYSKCKIQKVTVGNFYPFLSLFFVCFCRHENMGKLFNWRFLDINTETKTQHLDALFLLQSSSFAILFIAYRQNCGLILLWELNFCLKCDTWMVRHLFPARLLLVFFLFFFNIRALYVYKNMCTDISFCMEVRCLSAISLNVYTFVWKCWGTYQEAS